MTVEMCDLLTKCCALAPSFSSINSLSNRFLLGEYHSGLTRSISSLASPIVTDENIADMTAVTKHPTICHVLTQNEK